MIICADDYGFTDDIDGAILELSAAGKLSAVSCMVVLQRCSAESLARLLAHQAGLDIGLHLCLTDEGLPLCPSLAARFASPSFPSFGNLFRQTLLRRFGAGQLASFVSAQYQIFVEKCGRRPDFIDGHLHVHQFPQVRESLLEFVSNLPAGQRPYIRNTRPPLRELFRRRLPWSKAAGIGWFGIRMAQRLRKAGVPTNDGFAGVYDFRDWAKYRSYLPAFAASLPHRNGILVVHPGGKDDWRRAEFTALRECSFPSGTPNRFQR